MSASAGPQLARTAQVKLADGVRYVLLTSRAFWVSPAVTEASVAAAVGSGAAAVMDLPGVTARLAALAAPGLNNDLAIVLLQLIQR
jgi:hypothetical protein